MDEPSMLPYVESYRAPKLTHTARIKRGDYPPTESGYNEWLTAATDDAVDQFSGMKYNQVLSTTQVPAFADEYKGYNIGKLSSMHNHPITEADIASKAEGYAVWFPTSNALSLPHSQANRKYYFFMAIFIVATIGLLILLGYGLNSKFELAAWEWLVGVILAGIGLGAFLYTGGYVYSFTGDFMYNNDYINETLPQWGTSRSKLINFRRELVSAIDSGDTSIIEGKYGLRKRGE